MPVDNDDTADTAETEAELVAALEEAEKSQDCKIAVLKAKINRFRRNPKVSLLGIHCVSGTKFLGCFQLVVKQVHCNHWKRSCEGGPKNRAQPDTPTTDHYHRLPNTHLRIVGDGSKPGCQCVRQ
jgi:hypothetical protein